MFLLSRTAPLCSTTPISATVFLLLLCNDSEVLGPWVNRRWLNLFTGSVIWLLVLLSVVLTAATVFPAMSGATILEVLGGGTAFGIAGFAVITALRGTAPVAGLDAGHALALRAAWRMPPLETLQRARMSGATRLWMLGLRAYLLVAVALVALKVVQLALGQ